MAGLLEKRMRCHWLPLTLAVLVQVPPILVFGAGCSKSAEDQLKEAQAAVASDPAKAQQLAEEGLKNAGSDKATAWRLEQVRLEALAKGSKGAEVAKELERLAGTYPQQVTAALYRSLADKTKAAGDTSGAIDILAAGDVRFPADPTSKTAIEEIKGAGVSAEEVEKLKALGYL